MTQAIQLDPKSGLKTFNTRAAKATDKIAGKGYSVVTDEALKAMPELPPGATFNAEEQAKYRAFKEARRGAADYMAMEGDFKKYLDDVYSAPPIPREPLSDECEVLVVGYAGFSGLLLWQQAARDAGFTDVRFCEKGGDVGGTWYWNRYPGIACDVESYSYLPLLEETGYVPSMKFASGFEILEYCQRLADRFGFYDHCLFHTTVEATTWDEATGQVDGDHRPGRCDEGALRGAGQRHPDHAQAGSDQGHGDVQGRGVPHLALELQRRPSGQADRHHRHFGATAVQAIPELAKVAGELYVFQRTPSSIDVRDQRETTEEERATWPNEEGWAKARRARFARPRSPPAAPRCGPMTTTWPARSPTSRAQAVRPPAHAAGTA